MPVMPSFFAASEAQKYTFFVAPEKRVDIFVRDHTLGYLELTDLTRDVATGVRSQGWITAPLSALVMWESVAYSRLGLNLCHRPKPGWYWAAAPSPCYCRFDHKWRHIVNLVSLRSREPQELKQKKWLLQVCIYSILQYMQYMYKIV